MSPTPQLEGSIGIFGGSFDPVHNGHLRVAVELKYWLGLDEVRFIPCSVPPHRGAPVANTEARVKMLRAGIASEPAFVVDERELNRSGPSYTVDTLTSLRQEFPRHALFLLLGMDAFLSLPSWHQWTRLFDLAHIVVAQRPGAAVEADGALEKVLRERYAEQPAELAAAVAGRILIRQVTQLAISSTGLRMSVHAGVPAKYLVPEAVSEVIDETGCYAR